MKKPSFVDTKLNQPVPASENVQEDAVWEAFKQGDSRAFTDLVNTHYPLLLKYGLRICVKRELVKDCLHNLFIDIWNRRERLEEIRSIKAYLLTSLRRQLYKEVQRSRLTRGSEDLPESYDFQVQFAIESDIIDSETNAENLLKLRSNLQQLSKRQREAIYLRFYQDLAYEDIAQVMAINQHSAVNLVYEALKLLRRHWRMVVFMLYLPYI
ncbi:sigma-70 family RNA polymerase sigma factor (plasmid) [Spirosoma sp. SC4-14]|uniref:RNA polymerase sigma factor n=1 Tax=Spirosoma sp. SC4-14 TaxID=3128900 RepID=UPI0030D280C5